VGSVALLKEMGRDAEQAFANEKSTKNNNVITRNS
jgi:hypothetical protein